MKSLQLLLAFVLLTQVFCQKGSLSDLISGQLGQADTANNNNNKNEDDLDDIIQSVFNQNPATTTEGTDNLGGPNLNPSEPVSGGGINLNPSGGQTGALTGEKVGNCECVPYYLCKNNSIITNGEGLIDIRFGLTKISDRMKNFFCRKKFNGGRGMDNDRPCSNYLDVCCELKDKVEQPITTKRPETKLTGCGVRNPEGVGFRITGDKDNEAQFGEFPWMVAILVEETVEGVQKLNVYQCGGSLIHPQVVLTAAHCVSDKSKHNRLKIRAGEWDTQTKNELYAHQDRQVERVMIHKDYYAGALFYDVALLYLTEPVEIAENVNVVCLPDENVNLDGARCFASGWGKDVFGQEGRYQVILKKIELPIVPRDQCQKALRETRLGKHFELHRSFICAGGEPGKDTCKGDGGSPLVCPVPGQPNRYFQAGIVAWGIGCGENGTPGVYVNIPLMRSWIDEEMIYNSLDRKVYRATPVE